MSDDVAIAQDAGSMQHMKQLVSAPVTFLSFSHALNNIRTRRGQTEPVT